MKSGQHILALDQGTTSSRAIVFDDKLSPVATGQYEFTQHFPQSGWVEHDADEIWATTQRAVKTALTDADLTASHIAAIGITNQRETVVLWNRETGAPVHKAIVWQDRRTAETTARLKEEGHEATVTERTGLLLDPYFSSSKLSWLLDHVEGARADAEAGKLAFGTIDTWLIWKLTGGARHVTDATNAARTMLYNIHEGRWDAEMLAMWNIPEAIMPEVLDSAAEFGMTTGETIGAPVPIRGVAGDQQAATVGQACFEPGMLKSTYGTGCFALLNTGDTAVRSQNRLLTTIGYQIGGKPTYAVEGSIFVAGAAVQWLRDGMKMIESAGQTGNLADEADPHQNVYLVPAFVGLGAPYWDAEARGALYGMTRNTGPAEIAKATLESVAYQTRDLFEAMKKDGAATGQTVLRVDGGMTASDWTMQALADQLQAPVDRPVVRETTALGAAYLAAMQSGIAGRPDEFAKGWQQERQFAPKMAKADADAKYAGWLDAVRRTLSST
ncbi:glycerol kinase GlpK [Pontivivens insulae]|uniref:Glycerol kinase n=1 Tax=Pontivivens insulae TaxID=1639689 RepID=A0A2R8ACL0_9RHOB|nr:glycerol kinase GlpK [Pontivivens insulae]RED13875.1 glycerol kinase [Pontivivens insulae]SPF29949.1 Glycerol kinase [Pontivivens insulae]